MRRLLAYLVSFGLIIISQQSLAAEKTLTIVHSNDLHSHFLGAPSNIAYSPSITGNDDTLGGFARIAAVIKTVKQSRKNSVLVFDAGDGDDPDLAWARRHPDEPNSLQFAFKTDLTGPTGYMWSAWADAGLRAPDYMDYNDHFTAEIAGSPYPGSPLYPLKAVYLVDSTCRSYYGFTPSGDEPGLCSP